MQETSTAGLSKIACKIKQLVSPPCPEETRVHVHFHQQFSKAYGNTNQDNN